MPRPRPLVPIELGNKPTKNPVLIAINDGIRRYNLLYPTLANQRERNATFLVDGKAIGCLDDIFLHCIAYIVIRPPGSRSARGFERAQSCAEIIEIVQEHAAFFDIRFLRADLDGEKGKMNYWLERYDQNLFGDEIFQEFLSWMEESNDRRSLRDYKRDAKSSLQYFNELGRTKYEVVFAGGKARTVNGDLLNTSDGEGAFSGLSDSYIYVCSARTRKIYSAASDRGVVHHSSFLSGEPIIAGGDWVVLDGKLLFLNASSGHYRPTVGNMRLFLQVYQGSIDGGAFVQPTHKGPVYRVRDYLRLGESATPSPEGQRFMELRTSIW